MISHTQKLYIRVSLNPRPLSCLEGGLGSRLHLCMISESKVSFRGGRGGWGVGGGICPPLALAPLGYAEISNLHINVFKHL